MWSLACLIHLQSKLFLEFSIQGFHQSRGAFAPLPYMHYCPCQLIQANDMVGSINTVKIDLARTNVWSTYMYMIYNIRIDSEHYLTGCRIASSSYQKLIQVKDLEGEKHTSQI